MDDVGVAERRGDAKFRRQALVVFLGGFRGSAPEFLHGVELFFLGVFVVGLVRDAHDAEGAPPDDLLAFAVLLDEGVRAIGPALFVVGHLLALDLLDPGGHQRELVVGLVVFLLAKEHVAEHVAELLLAFLRLEEVFVFAVLMHGEALAVRCGTVTVILFLAVGARSPGAVGLGFGGRRLRGFSTRPTRASRGFCMIHRALPVPGWIITSG